MLLVNESRNNLPRIVVSLLIFGALVAAGMYFAHRSPRYGLLDAHLGASAWQPAALLDVLSWSCRDNNENPFGLGQPEFFDVQHQALLRLIDIQRHHFGRSTPPRNEHGTCIDHSFARVIERTDARIVVIGTATLRPRHYDKNSIHGPYPYWQMERLTFSPAGELLFREGHINE